MTKEELVQAAINYLGNAFKDGAVNPTTAVHVVQAAVSIILEKR